MAELVQEAPTGSRQIEAAELPTERVIQVRAGHTPTLTRGAVASRQRHIAQVGGAVTVVVVAYQDLAPPDGAVGAVSRAVERVADDALAHRHAMLRHDRGDVGVVMLDEVDLGTARLLRPPPGLSGSTISTSRAIPKMPSSSSVISPTFLPSMTS